MLFNNPAFVRGEKQSNPSHEPLPRMCHSAPPAAPLDRGALQVAEGAYHVV